MDYATAKLYCDLTNPYILSFTPSLHLKSQDYRIDYCLETFGVMLQHKVGLQECNKIH